MSNIQGSGSLINSAAIILTGLIDIKNDLIRFNLIAIITAILTYFVNLHFFKTLYNRFANPFTYATLTIREFNDNDGRDSIFSAFEEYTISNFGEKVKTAYARREHGDTLILLRDTEYFNIVVPEKSIDVNYRFTENGNNRVIEITGKTTTGKIKEAIAHVCAVAKPLRDFIQIYHQRITKGKAKNKKSDGGNSTEGVESVSWHHTYIITNKNFTNTVVSDDVQEKVFKRIEKFMSREGSAFYDRTGQAHRKSFILHGPPGCGKTSIVKAVAATYRAKVFVIDLSELTNRDLTSLITQISDEVENTPHIILFDDADKADLIKNAAKYVKRMRADPDYYDRYGDDNERSDNKKVSIDCLLQILDGIIEQHNQIRFITANSIANFELIEGLIRPGRVDHIVNIGPYTSPAEVMKMINLYYPDIPKTIEIEPTQLEITPASLINLILDNPDSPDPVIKSINEKHKLTLAENSRKNIASKSGLNNGRTYSASRSRRHRSRMSPITMAKHKIKRLEKHVSDNYIVKIKEQIKKKKERLDKLQKAETKRREKKKLQNKPNKQNKPTLQLYDKDEAMPDLLSLFCGDEVIEKPTSDQKIELIKEEDNSDSEEESNEEDPLESVGIINIRAS